MRVAVLADTHLGRRSLGRGARSALPAPVVAQLDRADVILHAGDVLVEQVLADLAGHGPTWAVLGNNDHELVGRLPETRSLCLEGVSVAMIHDAGPRRGREARLARRFPEADVVVFGHSHEPMEGRGLRSQLLFNPGSPTQRRRQPRPTMGWLELRDGQVAAHGILAL